MSDKYVIRNCPCYWHLGEDDGCSLENMKLCEDDTDCVLKQIVEYCKNIEKDHYWGMREIRFSQEILKLLDIQEGGDESN